MFIKGRLCWLLFKAGCVNLMKVSLCAMMSFRPVEMTKIVAKWSYQWKTEHAHHVLGKERLAVIDTWPSCAYWLEESAPSDMRRWTGDDWRWAVPHWELYLLPSFSGVCSIAGIVCFIRSSLQLSNEIEDPSHLRVWSNSHIPVEHSIENSSI